MPEPANTPDHGRSAERRPGATGIGRRGVLRSITLAAVGAGGGAALSGCTSDARAAAGRPGAPRPTFVLVHGANGNAASFAPLVTALTLAGRRAVAVDLPGHGPEANFPLSYQAPQDLAAFADAPSPVLAKTTLADNARHVAGIVRRLAARGPVILVGHSMGGATITRVGNQVPDLIARLVYVSAFCCVRRRSVLDWFTTPEAATTLLPTIPSVGDPERLGVGRTNWRSADPEFVATAKRALAADYDDAAFLAALNTFEPDESNAVATDDARGAPATWGTIPRTYVRFTRDRAIPLPLQNRMINEADEATPRNRFDVHSVNAPHIGPQNPRDLVTVLTRLA
ncbi:alpha/beta fold hydrolase [Streptomyces sparsogenes]|uniref:alpha/beta fold hydrolase n=1 Tax=Streptomyces sparsogenes TaxID=67365 RepID=UPI003321CF5F